MRNHKTILTAIRGVYFILIAALAIRAWAGGTLPVALPVILLVYFATIVAMMREGGRMFLHERVQGFLVFFDLFVLVVALVSLQEYRQDLLLALFLTVILASASRKLSMSIAGFGAIAFLYLWLSSPGQVWTQVLATQGSNLVALFVVAIYAGYLSESLTRETGRRIEAETRMSRELDGLRRGQDLAASLAAAMDPAQLLPVLAENSASILKADVLGLFWRRQGHPEFQLESVREFPVSLRAEWSSDRSLLERVLLGQSSLTGAAEGHGLRILLLTPMSAPISGLEAVFVAGWNEPDGNRQIEREALEVVASLGTILLENAALRGCLHMARDLWQGAFRSVPAPVVIVDGEDRILQANDAFVRSTGTDALDLVGRRFPEFLEDAADRDGRRILPEIGGSDSGTMGDVEIPRLGGSFDIVRGPYSSASGQGTIWVFTPAVPSATA